MRTFCRVVVEVSIDFGRLFPVFWYWQLQQSIGTDGSWGNRFYMIQGDWWFSWRGGRNFQGIWEVQIQTHGWRIFLGMFLPIFRSNCMSVSSGHGVQWILSFSWWPPCLCSQGLIKLTLGQDCRICFCCLMPQTAKLLFLCLWLFLQFGVSMLYRYACGSS